MKVITLKCPDCGQTISEQYPSFFGHELTEIALAKNRAIKRHQAVCLVHATKEQNNG